MAQRILITNGPGLDDLEGRFGSDNEPLTLDSIKSACEKRCADLGLDLEFRQTDDYQLLLDSLSNEGGNYAGLIINPFNLPDADSDTDSFYQSAMQRIAQLKKPAIEVRLTNIYKRDAEISRPLHKPQCDMGFVCGFGLHSYLLAISAVSQLIAAGS